jgi:hypothetical protein
MDSTLERKGGGRKERKYKDLQSKKEKKQTYGKSIFRICLFLHSKIAFEKNYYF